MANTFNNTTFTNIARAGFKAFTKKLAPLGVFTTDFSDEVAEQGTVVGTRIVPVSDAAVDLQNTDTGGSGDRESSNIIKNITTGAVSVTLNQQPIAGFALTDEEAGQIGAGVWEDTKDKIIQNKAFAVANFVLNYCFNLITAADYASPDESIIAASAFDMDDVVDLSVVAAQTGWPTDRNYLVLDPTYLGALKKDNHIQDLSASGIKVVQDGLITKLDRFSLVEAPTLADATVYSGTEDLRGWINTPDAMAIAMRAVKSQATDKLEDYQVLTDESGVTLVYRAWYSARYGKMYMTFETLFGAAKANTTALKRIVAEA